MPDSDLQMSLFSSFLNEHCLHIWAQYAHQWLLWARRVIWPSSCRRWTHCRSLYVCAGFRGLLSLQASRRGEEGFVWPQGDAHQTAKRTTGKTVVSSHTAHCRTVRWQQKAKRQIELHTESVYITREKSDASVNDSLSNSVFLSVHTGAFHLSPWPKSELSRSCKYAK